MTNKKWDEFDEAAEAEGKAFKTQIVEQITHKVGKGIRKQRQMHHHGQNTNEMKIYRRLNDNLISRLCKNFNDKNPIQNPIIREPVSPMNIFLVPDKL